MLYENLPEGLELEEVATLSARRGMELAILASAAGILAALVVLPGRLPEEAHTIIYGVFGIVGFIMISILLFLWSSPPAFMVQQAVKALAARQAQGKPVTIISRPTAVGIGVLAFVFAYGLVGFMPL